MAAYLDEVDAMAETWLDEVEAEAERRLTLVTARVGRIEADARARADRLLEAAAREAAAIVAAAHEQRTASIRDAAAFGARPRPAQVHRPWRRRAEVEPPPRSVRAELGHILQRAQDTMPPLPTPALTLEATIDHAGGAGAPAGTAMSPRAKSQEHSGPSGARTRP